MKAGQMGEAARVEYASRRYPAREVEPERRTHESGPDRSDAEESRWDKVC